MQKYQVSPHVTIVRNYEGSADVFNLLYRKSQKLNVDAVNILLMLDKGTSIEELLEKMKAKVSASKYENIKNKLLHLVDSLVQKGIIISGRSNKAGIIRQETINPSLKSIQFEITRRCNLRCQHCYLEDYLGKDELTTEEVFDLIDQAAAIGVTSFHITGGEPLVRKDLKEVLAYIKEKGLYGQLYTNGTLLNDKFIEYLKDMNISVVKISLDGFNAETHDQFRRAKNSYKKAIESIRKLQKAGIPVEVGSVINKVNIKEAGQLINFIKNELKVNYHIDSFVPVGQGLKNQKMTEIDDWEYVNAMKEEIAIAYHESKKLQLAEDPNDMSKYFYCGAGNNYVFITSRGKVKFCPSMSDELNGGNLRELNLENIWLNGKVFTEHRNTNCKFINECPHYKECKGGCRSRSISKYGGMTEPDLESCRMFFAITKVKPPGLVEFENLVST